ncbi:DNA mismatch repair protein MutS [Lactococcus hodotermopsidis]|uniref:DNA mismatch repair protein MutS n=1 Tax=Pseudolactococcus hodotermopsidis TaxID=2709157 RepID=A0A6A0BF75_9LACT|nr:DNA mismatch repair protein MutS [Lactococcus hodotermopsidis]GFH43353.1 DNA mismatch repair protein MutS [Lactococcus hodotermopsidis]
MATTEKISPGMQQYLDIKKSYPDAFLLFRMGDFYELFYEDAVKAAQILELTLTSRNKNSDKPIPMAGVPYHSIQQYIDTLVDLGHKVAIAEQMEDPKTAVGVVKRDVVQVITPGTAVDALNNGKENNFLVAIETDESAYALSYLDLATGEFFVTSLSDFETVTDEISSLKAREVVMGYEPSEVELQILENQLNVLVSRETIGFDNADLIDYGLSALEISVTSKLLNYIMTTQKRQLTHLQPVKHYEIKDFLLMDAASKKSLDLISNARTGKKMGSLYWLLDETKTAMGTRMLRTWIDRPLVSESAIQKRQAIIQTFLDHFFERSDLTETLKGVYDIERLAARVSFGKANPKDLLQLAQTLSNVPAIKAVLTDMQSDVLFSVIGQLDEIPELFELIRNAIDENAPAIIMDGNIIKSGFNATLDDYRVIMRDGTSWIAELETKERATSGISNLKIDYNKKDGYYFHITNSNLSQVPEHFFRKATLKNSERYGTEALAKLESQMLDARENSANLEYELFLQVREQTEKFITRIQKLAKVIAGVDVLQSLAVVAENNHYIKPDIIKNGQEIHIKNGRHAVVEKVMGAQEYVPNSIDFDEKTMIQLITGPNMSGKSTYMRELALTVVMAQLGSYIPADSVLLPIFDAIFTRIGAADDLISGQSTFMVEMMEANHAIRRATKNSLILFDELGRGTATYDGIALAQAIVEYIHENVGAKTLFATHYHELVALETVLEHLTNVHVATLEENGEVTFLHKIETGPADKSYGIHVAKIAGLPSDLLERASVILSELEDGTVDMKVPPVIPVQSSQSESQQLDLFGESSELAEKIRAIDIMNLTPMAAMNELFELKKLV